MGRFFRTLEDGLWHYGSMSAYTSYYNEKRLHFPLGIDNCRTPSRAFYDKKADDAIRRDKPKWMEEDAYEGAT